VEQATFTPDSRQIITLCQDAAYRWDLSRNGVLAEEPRPLILGVRQPRVRPGAANLDELAPGDWPVREVAADEQGRYVLAAGGWHDRSGGGVHRGWAMIWDSKRGTPVTPVLRHPSEVRQATFSPGETGLVSTVDHDGVVRLWDLRKPNQPVYEAFPAPWAAVHSAFGQDGKNLYLLALTREKPSEASGHAGVRIWSVAGGRLKEVTSLQYKKEAPFTTASFSPDCKRVVAATGEGVQGIAVVWELGRKGQPVELRQPEKEWAHDERITSATFCEEASNWLVTTSTDDTAVVWSLKDGKWSGEKLQGNPKKGDPVEGHTADVLTAAFDRTGSRVVTAGADPQAIVWERANGRYRPVAVLALGAPPAQVTFSGDSEQRYVLTAGQGTTQLWDAKDGRMLATKRQHGRTWLVRWRNKPEDNLNALIIGSPSTGPEQKKEQPGEQPQRADPSWVTVSAWDLSPAEGPSPKRLRRKAELIACRKLDKREDVIRVTRLTAEEVYQLWEEHPERVATAGAEGTGAAAWHEREADWSEAFGLWRATRFHLNQALRLAPPGQQARLQARLALAKAHVLAELGKWKEAAQVCNKAAHDHPKVVPLALFRAHIWVQLRQRHEAARAYLAIIALEPWDPTHRLRLAEVYLQPLKEGQPVGKEELEAATRCLTNATKAIPSDSMVWVQLAAVQLAAGDVRGYQATRRHILKQFKDRGPGAANYAAWAASLAADAPDDKCISLELARMAVARYPNALGPALYRAGKYKEAATCLREATRHQAKDDPKLPPPVLLRLFLAMSEHSSEQTEQTRKQLRSVLQEIKDFNGKGPGETPELSMSRAFHRLQFRVLMQEAEQLIEKK
jgi:WD40 repeat protein/tetratricopeptide (TPR) repeat protein